MEPDNGDPDEHEQEITIMLRQASSGSAEAKEQLFTTLLNELRASANSLMKRERPDHTLQPSALMNEALVRLLSSGVLDTAKDRRYLFASATRAMKQVLIDHARKRKATKRPTHAERLPFDILVETLETRDQTTVEELVDGLEQLAGSSPRQAEIIELSFFVGCTTAEIAAILEISPATVKRELSLAKIKLAKLLRG